MSSLRGKVQMDSIKRSKREPSVIPTFREQTEKGKPVKKKQNLRQHSQLWRKKREGSGIMETGREEEVVNM